MISVSLDAGDPVQLSQSRSALIIRTLIISTQQCHPAVHISASHQCHPSVPPSSCAQQCH
ncbi:unnamed protein product, partial [Staurois parvus]